MLLAGWLASPLYLAVSECEPAPSPEGVSVAVKQPAKKSKLRGTVPSTVEPSRKVTIPVTVPAPLTVARSERELPKGNGFAEVVSAVPLAAWFTVTVTGAELLPGKFALPQYVAVMVWVPALSADVVRLAWLVPLLNQDKAALSTLMRPSISNST